MNIIQIPVTLLWEIGTDQAILLIVLNDIASNTKPLENGFSLFSYSDVKNTLTDWENKRIRKTIGDLREFEILQYKKNTGAGGKGAFKIDENKIEKFQILQQQKKEKRTKKKKEKKSNTKEKKKRIKEENKKEEKDDFFRTHARQKTRQLFFEEVPDTNSKNYSKSNFEKLWKEWPGKIKGSKAEAFKIFQKLSKQSDSPNFETILKAVQDQSKSDLWKDGFIPHVRTWLHNGRWIDEPEHLKRYAPQTENEKIEKTPANPKLSAKITKIFENKLTKPLTDIDSAIGKAAFLVKTWRECQSAWRIVPNGKEKAQFKAIGIDKFLWKDHLRKCNYLPDCWEMFEHYVEFLEDADFIASVRPNLFDEKNQILKQWLADVAEELRHDLLTGKSI